MNGREDVTKIVVSTMNPRERRMREAPPAAGTKRGMVERRRILPKHLPALAAVVCCLCAGAAAVLRTDGGISAVMEHVTAGFQIDDSLGHLQFVSNILPESAMVFLTSGDAEQTFMQPVDAQAVHAWSESEPWLEYACSGDVSVCGDGEVMTVVRSRQDEYTVRVMHEGGYESIYSGLTAVSLREGDEVKAGQTIGAANGDAAFELRRDGLSVMPAFAAQ